MRIGVDATTWSNRRGYGRYTRALLTALLELDQRNQYTFFVDREREEFALPPGVDICHVAASVPTTTAAGADSRRSLSDMWAVASAVRRAQVEFIYFPTDYSYVPLYMGVPRIVTIHDAISELFPDLVFPTLRSKIFYRAKERLGILQARLLVTVSEFSRRQLVERLKIPPTRLRVVSEAADPIFRPLEHQTDSDRFAPWGLPVRARLLVYVGGFSPHKNLFMLLDVARELLRQEVFQDLFLVLVGDHSGDSFFSCYKQLTERVSLDGLKERILFPGRLEDEDLVALLNRAEALILPSFCEGFGLPGVEAAACGTPVIATTESPLPELLGEGVISVKPGDCAGWLRALERVLTDRALRVHMREECLAATSRLSWRNSAAQLLSIFDELQAES